MNQLSLPRILLVDDEPENLRALERSLRGRCETVSCATAAEALEKIETVDFAVVISDQRMPDMVGTELLARAARKRPLTTRIILTAFTETKDVLDAINHAEIFRYITKPWNNSDLLSAVQQGVEHHRLRAENEKLVTQLRELNHDLERLVAERTAELQLANEKLSELAMTDPLTKVLNRRAFFARFQDEIQRSRRYEHPVVVVMIDVDHFKSFNDMEGHLYGDEALRKVAALLTSNLRKTDVLCRYGGEEFTILMPETKMSNALEICNRLRTAVETTPFQNGKAGAYLTISLGLAGFPQHGASAEELVRAADEALYEAKEAGRNRIVVHK